MQKNPFDDLKNLAKDGTSGRVFEVLPPVRPHTPLLDQVDSPKDLKGLALADLLQLADELRVFLLYAIGQSGGHFGANLGVVELTLALHFLLDLPKDKLLWDVGHQAYAHKALTGRRDRLPSIRSKGGLTAFPERGESIFDEFGVGHSSTAISAGLGMSLALRYQGRSDKVVCVVGDGAMTAGMAFEAMNDAVQNRADLLVILNDNQMSISQAIGGFSKHLAKLWDLGWQVDIDTDHQPVLKPRFGAKNADPKPPIGVDNLFRAIGFEYFGPFDGHDLPELLRILDRLKTRKGCVLLHLHTVKGKGFLPAQKDPVGYHAIGKLSDQVSIQDQANSAKSAPKLKKYSQVFGEFLCDKAELDPRLIGITPAMMEGSGMVEFAKRYPDRFFDVAIAEQHAVTLAGGMATQGIKPIVAIYSTFLQRGYDQLVHDIALQNLDVLFAIDRAGLVGEDGATHAGVFDLAYMRCLPNLVIATPKDENECYHLLNTCYEYQGVTAVRYPRGTGTGVQIQKPFIRYQIGKAVIEQIWHAKADQTQNHPPDHLQNAPKKAAILAFGSPLETAKKAILHWLDQSNHPDWQITLVNMRWVKPLDHALLQSLIQDGTSHLITIEEHAIMGGAGSAVNEFLLAQGAQMKVKNLGIPDRFIEHASHAEQLALCGLDENGIYQNLVEFLT